MPLRYVFRKKLNLFLNLIGVPYYIKLKKMIPMDYELCRKTYITRIRRCNGGKYTNVNVLAFVWFATDYIKGKLESINKCSVPLSDDYPILQTASIRLDLSSKYSKFTFSFL